MTRTELYDLACRKWKDPAVILLGDECILGEWMSVGEVRPDDGVVLSNEKQAVQVLARAATWDELAVKVGLDEDTPVTNTRMVTVKDAAAVLAHKEPSCDTYGCNEPRTDGAFCPRCFQERRADRELHSPPITLDARGIARTATEVPIAADPGPGSATTPPRGKSKVPA